jgi:hypothetical protein
VLALFHQLSVTLAVLEFADVLLEPLLLHAASTVAAVAATATPRITRFLCMLFVISPRGSGRRPFPKVLGRLSMVPSS